MQIALMRAASAADKLRAAGELTAAAVLLARTGLRARHPEATEAEIAREQLARKAFGPLP
jgi:hypothetical protein